MRAPISLSVLEARRFHRRAVLLDEPAAGIGEALSHHGFVQIDPINVCGRMHDLILRNRVADYAEGGLMRHLHGLPGEALPPEQRSAFEHHLPHSSVLAAMPVEAWPYLQAVMRHRSSREGAWSGALDARQAALAKVILTEMAQRGPLSSDEMDDGQRDHFGWGSSNTLAKTTLMKLFFHGQVLIARREGQRRLYDLPHRVLPASILSAPEPNAEEVSRWVSLLKLRQFRLATLSKVELPHVADLVQPVRLPEGPIQHMLAQDLPLLEERGVTDLQTTLLAPLDPLIYDRKLTRQLWGFDYTWEVYTPAAKRIRGYYALPVLAGHEIVGHIDPKADRIHRKLVVVNRSLRRGRAAGGAVKALAKFLGMK